MVVSVATATAQASGLPPNVLPCVARGSGPCAVPPSDRAHRQAAANGFRQRDDIGHDAGMLEAEPLAGAPEAGLNLVDDEHGASGIAAFAQRLQVLACGGMHAALALNGFDHDSGCVFCDRRLRRRDVIESDMLDAGQPVLEGFPILGRPGH